MYSTPAHSANRALSPSSKSSSSLLSCCYRSSQCFGPDWLRADRIKQHECRGKILRLGVGSGYRLTTRTCASFCKLDRIHALNHRRNKFLHTHARTLTHKGPEMMRSPERPQTSRQGLCPRTRWNAQTFEGFQICAGPCCSVPCSAVYYILF